MRAETVLEVIEALSEKEQKRLVKLLKDTPLYKGEVSEDTGSSVTEGVLSQEQINQLRRNRFKVITVEQAKANFKSKLSKKGRY